MNIAAIILAAGKGTRINNGQASPIPKVMFELAGKPVIYHSVQLLKDAGVDDIYLVVGYKKELIKNYFGNEVGYVDQNEQLGTGHAVMMAKKELEGKSDAVIVFYGDCPLYKPETVKKLIEIFGKDNPTIAMLTAVSNDAGAYGRVIRTENGDVANIIEAKDCDPEQIKGKEWNPGFYLFNAEWLWENIENLKNDNAQKEYYLTDLIKMAVDQNKKVIAIPVSEEFEALGINTQEQLKQAEIVLESRGK
jgi:UDP-N-acetylglucosamine diphosphorylase/glucosamine-1-phosphate N-acetyltransferase